VYASSLTDLTLGKAGQLAESLRACHDPSVSVHLALELDLVIHWTLFQFPLELFAAVSMFPSNYMHSLENAASPRAALPSVWPIEF
jgi:hypothetical protein